MRRRRSKLFHETKPKVNPFVSFKVWLILFLVSIPILFIIELYLALTMGAP